MKLELKHLAAYLPYGLKIANKSLRREILSIYEMEIENKNDKGILNVIHGVNQIPILRRLSDLTKEIEHNGEKFVPIGWLEDKYYTLDLHKQCLKLIEEYGENLINQSDYMLVEHLLEWHFDIFGLIDEGLAIDINTLNKQ